jgi:curved DNA-binding protein CbpA
MTKASDYYEFLQISPNAESDTFHRVDRFLVRRLQPDNPETCDAKQFFLLKPANDILSSPERRAEYNASCKKKASYDFPLSTTIDFMDSMEGELNGRLAALALPYIQRRTNSFKLLATCATDTPNDPEPANKSRIPGTPIILLAPTSRSWCRRPAANRTATAFTRILGFKASCRDKKREAPGSITSASLTAESK